MGFLTFYHYFYCITYLYYIIVIRAFLHIYYCKIENHFYISFELNLNLKDLFNVNFNFTTVNFKKYTRLHQLCFAGGFQWLWFNNSLDCYSNHRHHCPFIKIVNRIFVYNMAYMFIFWTVSCLPQGLWLRFILPRGFGYTFALTLRSLVWHLVLSTYIPI